MDTKIIDEHKKDFDGAVTHFEEELSKIRTGRAHPSLIENITVAYYGNPTPLKQVANISIPEARQFLIQPWSADSLANIEAALKEANLGLTPNNEGEVIRITLPPMTEENRKDLTKVLGQKAEDARISVRNAREDAWHKIQEEEKKGEMSEDDKFALKDALQKVVDEYNGKIESLRKKKEEDVMTV